MGLERRRPDPTKRAERRSTDHGAPYGRSFVIITGMSGAGKSQLHKCFEDLGYLCIDNLPLRLVPAWARLWRDQRETKTAIIADVRDRSFRREFGRVVSELRRIGVRVHLIFLETDDAVLLRRFSETRRPHPLARRGEPLPASIARERRMLRAVRATADEIINTSRQTVHQLRKLIFEKFGGRPHCLLSIESFGFRYGLPPESDLVIDVRMLPNPFFDPKLKAKTGLDRGVVRFLLSNEETKRMIDQTLNYLRFLLPLYLEEGKSYLTMSFGCTGGKHRSVFMAEQIGRALAAEGFDVAIHHRDISAE